MTTSNTENTVPNTSAPLCNPEPSDILKGENKKKVLSNAVEKWIAKFHLVTTKDNNEIYAYHEKEGVYKNGGNKFLAEIAEKRFKPACNSGMVSEILGMVQRRTYIEREMFNANLTTINLQNGLLDLDTGELLPHTSECYTTVQLPLRYDPKADCSRIRKFFSEIVDPEDTPLLEEIVGWLLWREYNVHKAVMLYGAGRNGKGAFLRLLESFLGLANVSHVGLQELISNRFAKADLVGKLANIYGDLPQRNLSDTDTFKCLTGSDTIRVEHKYKQPFDLKNTAKMVFSANKLPMTPDNTYGFYSRWIIILFPNRFDTEERPANKNLDAELSTPEELSGLLNMALQGLQRLRSNDWKFSYRLTVDEVTMMYQRLSNPVFAFVQDCCESSEDYISKHDLYNAYKQYAKDHSLPILSMKGFTQSLQEQSIIPVEHHRPTVGNSQIYAWLGIQLKDSYDSCDSSNPCSEKEKEEKKGIRVSETPTITTIKPEHEGSFVEVHQQDSTAHEAASDESPSSDGTDPGNLVEDTPANNDGPSCTVVGQSTLGNYRTKQAS